MTSLLKILQWLPNLLREKPKSLKYLTVPCTIWLLVTFLTSSVSSLSLAHYTPATLASLLCLTHQAQCTLSHPLPPGHSSPGSHMAYSFTSDFYANVFLLVRLSLMVLFKISTPSHLYPLSVLLLLTLITSICIFHYLFIVYLPPTQNVNSKRARCMPFFLFTDVSSLPRTVVDI